jgi:hypothetical protein
MPFCPNCGRSGISEGMSCPTCEAVGDVVDPDATIQRVPRTSQPTPTTNQPTPIPNPPTPTTNQPTPSNKIVIRFDDPPEPPPAIPENTPGAFAPTSVSAPVQPIAPVPPPRSAAYAMQGHPVPPSTIAGGSVQRTSGMAIAALVCGIIGVSAVAIILGFVARSQIKRSGGREKGEGIAVAGIVLGFVWVAISIIFTISVLALANSASGA